MDFLRVAVEPTASMHGARVAVDAGHVTGMSRHANSSARAKGKETLALSPTRLELAGKSDLGPDIILDDAKGTPRMDLGLEHSVPFVLLNDDKGIIRMDMGLERSEPALVISDDKATPRVGFGLSGGRPSISVTGDDGFKAMIGSQPLVGSYRHTLLDLSRVARPLQH